LSGRRSSSRGGVGRLGDREREAAEARRAMQLSIRADHESEAAEESAEESAGQSVAGLPWNVKTGIAAIHRVRVFGDEDGLPDQDCDGGK
jgi:hypothetical protein